MKVTKLSKAILCATLILFSATTAMAQRTVMNFNFGWKFHYGSFRPDSLSTANLNDWQSVDLPHDFQISQPWVKPEKGEKKIHLDGASFTSVLSARGFKPLGKGTYVKKFTPSDSLKDHHVLLDFEGVLYVANVYLNGERIGGTDYGYLGFDIDISKKLKFGQENTLVVIADTRGPYNSRWYTGAGLYRDVRLVTTDADSYLARHPLHVTTENNNKVNLEVEVFKQPETQKVNLNVVIRDNTGKKVYDRTDTKPYFSPKEAHELGKIPSNIICWDTITINNSKLWDCETPNLYTVEVRLLDDKGNTVDQARQRFGFRTFEVDPAFGLKLNGKKLLLKGVANHHTLGALGAAAYPRAIEKTIRLLKDFGVNCIRTSHNPYSESFLDFCDSLGIVVIDEIYDKWLDQFTGDHKPFEEMWQHDLVEWIKRDRNHPSVSMWSLGNEEQTFTTLPFQDWGVTQYRMMKTLIGRYDSTRKLTMAMHPRGRTIDVDGRLVSALKPKGENPKVNLPSPLALECDVAGYNYSYNYFETDGQKYPNMVFFQSEATTGDMGPNFFGMNLNKVVGLAYWGVIDYLGESAGWPAKGWERGVIDVSLQPKPKAWLMRSMFKPQENVVHVAIVNKKNDTEIWNGVNVASDGMSDHWNQIPGKSYTVKVYTNCDSVALVVNGKEIGGKANSMNPKRRNQIQFDSVKYEPGYIEAIAYRNGDKVASHRIETAGKAVKLNLSPDNHVWKADGKDLMHIRVTAVDNKGRRSPMAQENLRFSVEGDAHIVAVDNGNFKSNDSFTGSERHLYNGSALVVIRAGRKPGKVTLKIEGEGYPTKTIKLKTI